LLFSHSIVELAARLRVFKVETIGDCYVAVTGLPDPQPSHAPKMVRFASGCILKMSQLVHELSVTLGPDTRDLKLRVGLHSGPVTAGVLRGQKARFQLFGDTVNTAARMESLGVPERIHCSGSTAKYLRDAGRANWLVARDELVSAKGKGEMQTYFVFATSSDSASGYSALSTGTSLLSNETTGHMATADDEVDEAWVPMSIKKMHSNSRLSI
jgi:class 3 adenylate cyclase